MTSKEINAVKDDGEKFLMVQISSVAGRPCLSTLLSVFLGKTEGNILSDFCQVKDASYGNQLPLRRRTTLVEV